jgi:hypothetical protein
MDTRKIIFYCVHDDFFIYKNTIHRYYHHRKRKLYSENKILIDDFINEKNVYYEIIKSEFNKYNVDETFINSNIYYEIDKYRFNNFDVIEDCIYDEFLRNELIKYFEYRKTKGDKYFLTYKQLSPLEITEFYTFEIWVDIKENADINKRTRIKLDMYPNEDNNIIVNSRILEEREMHFGRQKINTPWDNRSYSYLIPIIDITKIIGIKRFKDTDWLGTEREYEYNGKTDEYEMDISYKNENFYFAEKKYVIFKQHNSVIIND